MKKYDTSNTLTESLFKPSSSWVLPTSFPNLSKVKVIGIDTETCDPYILDRGPGFIRRDARVVGVSIGVEDKGWYFPVDHLGGGNCNREAVIYFLSDLLKRTDLTVCGANLQYDIEALEMSLGVKIAGKLVDVQVAEALINEESMEGYSLEALTRKYLGEGKDETLLNEAAEAYNIHPKSGLWKLHAKYVGPYAEFDAMAPVQIFKTQLEILKKEKLLDIFALESKLLPLLWEMRRIGIPVDVDQASRVVIDLQAKENVIRAGINKEFGCKIDEWSGKMLASLCDRLGYQYNRSEKGNPSFESSFLENSHIPVLKQIGELREINRLRTVFVQDWIFKNQIKGRIHPQWKQLASDDGGTRTGRMAAANPNPQQVPGRSDLAPMIRGIFRPPALTAGTTPVNTLCFIV
jgi:DNA polymerase I-like protein with 3'-5' exonuclease and polymerase domains